MLANGIKNSTIYHNGNSVISNSTIILYIGTIEAHPGLPAFLKIFHKLTIISIEARLPPIKEMFLLMMLWILLLNNHINHSRT